jgi:hypothetical protein
MDNPFATLYIINLFFSGLCYFASSAPLVWYQALSSCASRDGRLANPKTWKEWRDIIPNANQNYWTGEQLNWILQKNCCFRAAVNS